MLLINVRITRLEMFEYFLNFLIIYAIKSVDKIGYENMGTKREGNI